jgi:hypothetical protein
MLNNVRDCNRIGWQPAGSKQIPDGHRPAMVGPSPHRGQAQAIYFDNAALIAQDLDTNKPKPGLVYPLDGSQTVDLNHRRAGLILAGRE